MNMEVTMILQEYERWIQKCQDAELLHELEEICGDEEKIRDRFYSELSFGTGGLRGVIGAGSNRMNIYTVGKATQGYADYLKMHAEHPSVAIAHDNRKNSDLFAERAACILAENGVTVYMYPVLTPTPMLSYAVRYFHADGGIVITASHNPAVYNGYKVYGPDGCQITDDAAVEIENCIRPVDCFDGVKTGEMEELKKRGLIRTIGPDCNESYLDMIGCLTEGRKEDAEKLSLVYTPLNGTGLVPVLEALKRAGFSSIKIVEEQKEPDPAFPTCPYPNPEIREALELGIREMRVTGADLLLATDPDCDRVGTAVWDNGELRLMTGNEIGVLLMDYVCSKRVADGTMPTNPVMVKTIVTTGQAEEIARSYGVELRNVLTGFKYIGEQIGLLEKEGHPERYLLGFEESYGYLSGTNVRDKDGVNAAVLICRMAAEWKKLGKSLADALRELQQRFGVWKQSLESMTFPGENGMKEMAGIMEKLRRDPPKELLGTCLTVTEDYLLRIRKNHLTGKEEKITLPVSNVMLFRFGEEMTLVVRPSGTEPKLKLYLSVRAEDQAAAERKMEQMCKSVLPLIRI